jgi:hypothetical protein
MGQAQTDPVDYARLIVLDHLTSECCKASRNAKSEVVTMSNEIKRAAPRLTFDELTRPQDRSFEAGCATEDEGSVLATILVMVICTVLSVAVVNWFIFHY